MVKPIDRTEELSLSFLNGNITYVVDEICAMSPAEAAYAAGTITSLYMLNGHNADAASLLRLILRRIED